ncbi:hypothetical protein BHM03_00030775 [Ensete ventricosum]|nr:hypothetical protein BHM03_00030775 [Ensete ventricosum]
MQWDLARSSLEDSLNGSASSLGARKEITGRRPDDLPQECRRRLNRPYLGIWVLSTIDPPRANSSDDTVGSRQKFAKRFVEEIGNLAGNAKGDHRKEDRRTCRKIIGGYWSIREGGSRPQHGWSGSDPCPSYLVVQLFFLDTREGNCCHKSVRLPHLYFSSDLRL